MHTHTYRRGCPSAGAAPFIHHPSIHPSIQVCIYQLNTSLTITAHKAVTEIHRPETTSVHPRTATHTSAAFRLSIPRVNAPGHMYTRNTPEVAPTI
mmetsp:Transcript_2722/g.6179  ORF Transcript_2722/g.6179 Transcript_2722/m.6179 type:complete len:96 (+) Transcript_2722:232-519(+)